MDAMSGVPGVQLPWQAAVIRQARALECNCPPWVIHGEAWHDPEPWLISYWAAWCTTYDAAQNQVESERADNKVKLMRYAQQGKYMKQRAN